MDYKANFFLYDEKVLNKNNFNILINVLSLNTYE